MSKAASELPLDQRYFEDYDEGDVFDCGEIEVTEQEIIEFASRFDPQPFHIDPVAARNSIYGGVIASGWHTSSLLMRCLVDNYIPSAAGLGSPGVDNIRWPRPVRGGDTLKCTVTVGETRRSRSKPDRGIVVSSAVLKNQHGETVMEMTSTGFVRCRAASPAELQKQ